MGEGGRRVFRNHARLEELTAQAPRVPQVRLRMPSKRVTWSSPARSVITEEQGSGNDEDYGETDGNFDNTTGNQYDYDNDNVAAIVIM